MNRRRFLWRIGSVGAMLIGSWVSLFDRRLILKIRLSYSGPPEPIQALYARKFVKAFPYLTLEKLIGELCDRGIYSGGEFHIDRIGRNAVSDQLMEFDSFLWTESELLLYAVIARLYCCEEIMNDTF